MIDLEWVSAALDLNAGLPDSFHRDSAIVNRV
jgi:hypothetical protein